MPEFSFETFEWKEVCGESFKEGLTMESWSAILKYKSGDTATTVVYMPIIILGFIRSKEYTYKACIKSESNYDLFSDAFEDRATRFTMQEFWKQVIKPALPAV